MKQEKHNDQIFRNKLENYSFDPPGHIWAGIQEQLMKNKKSRKILYIRWISAAAAILLAFLGGWYFNQSTEISQPVIAEKNAIQQNESSINETLNPESEVNSPKTNVGEYIASVSKTENTNTDIQLVASNKPEKQVNVISSEIRSRETNALVKLETRKSRFDFDLKAGIHLSKSKPVSVSADALSESDRILLARNAENAGATNTDSRLKFGMMVSPGYSSQVTSHSESYASNISYSASNGNTNVTGGISVQVKTGKRISVESGLYYDQNGQKSEYSLQLLSMSGKRNEMYASPSTDQFSNSVEIKDGSIVMNSNAGIIALNTLPAGTEIASSMESLVTGASNTIVTSGDLSQVFDFIQIPLYMRYKVVDSHFDVEMIGGFNAGMLVGNNAYINNEYGSQNIGKTKDISSINISGTLGVGLNYKLGNHFSIGAEPRFNYFLSSINKNSDVSYKPYRIGFYTGIYYEF